MHGHVCQGMTLTTSIKFCFYTQIRLFIKHLTFYFVLNQVCCFYICYLTAYNSLSPESCTGQIFETPKNNYFPNFTEDSNYNDSLTLHFEKWYSVFRHREHIRRVFSPIFFFFFVKFSPKYSSHQVSIP